MTYRAAVALGSNLGDRLARLRNAVDALRDIAEVRAVSGLYETVPVGGPEQGPYLNAVVVVSTDMAADALVAQLLRIEAEEDRRRDERWGPRSLDLDLISMVGPDGETLRVDTDDVQLPHPRAHQRRFVVAPLLDVWPGATLAHGGTALDRQADLADQDVELLGYDWVDRKKGTARRFLAAQLVVGVGYAIVLRRSALRPSISDPAVWLGGSMTIAGACLAIWGTAALGEALSPFPEPRQGTELVERGPYRVVRHPIYSGLVVGAFGLAVLARSLPALMMALGAGGFLSAKARYEERRLRISVPGYAAYQRMVRGRLLPVTKASV